MGTPAGFAAFRNPRINAMLKKILSVWCEFPQQRRLALRAQRFAVRLEMRRGPAHCRHGAVRARPAGRALGVCLVERLLHPALQGRRASGGLAGRRQGDRQRMRAHALRHQHGRPAPGSPVQRPAVVGDQPLMAADVLKVGRGPAASRSASSPARIPVRASSSTTSRSRESAVALAGGGWSAGAAPAPGCRCGGREQCRTEWLYAGYPAGSGTVCVGGHCHRVRQACA
jgi:Phophatidylserine decarboxylase